MDFLADPEVDRLAGRLAGILGMSPIEAVRRALVHALEREDEAGSLVRRGMAFARDLRQRAGSQPSQRADDEFIDGLYGKD